MRNRTTHDRRDDATDPATRGAGATQADTDADTPGDTARLRLAAGLVLAGVVGVGLLVVGGGFVDVGTLMDEKEGEGRLVIGPASSSCGPLEVELRGGGPVRNGTWFVDGVGVEGVDWETPWEQGDVAVLDTEGERVRLEGDTTWGRKGWGETRTPC